MYFQLLSSIKEAVQSQETEIIISPFSFTPSTPFENQLLFFFKPECFNNQNWEQTSNIMKMTFEKFKQFQVEIGGMLLLDGPRLEELEIMNNHYGFINRLSREASKILTLEEINRIASQLKIENINDCLILGGHEFLKQFPQYNPFTLNDAWLTKKSFKLRSGFYYNIYEIENRKIILVNGFNPIQIYRFTQKGQKLLVLLLYSNTEWNVLKNDLSGDTYPERAKENSIRGELYKHNEKYGIPIVNVSNNGIHLSAGPFEALFEIDNFLHRIAPIRFDVCGTNIGRRMLELGYTKEEIMVSLSNPIIHIDDSEVDLDTYTEGKNTTSAISNYVNHFPPTRI